MITSFFVFGGVAFWVLTLAIFAAMVAAIEYESGVWATVLLVGYVAAIHLLGDVNIITVPFEHPGKTLGVIAGYFILGGVSGSGSELETLLITTQTHAGTTSSVLCPGMVTMGRPPTSPTTPSTPERH
jgi:hypothetical protein